MKRLATLLIGVLAAGACADEAKRTPGPTQAPPASAFVSVVDNPWFPLRPGARYVYTGEEDGEPLRDVVVVTRKTKVVQGVRTRVVDDSVYKNGELVEKTHDWYAQDRGGNVWYFGEDTVEIENGEITSREGSWEAGKDGARAGIFMPARPKIGQSEYQEYYRGHAEDRFEVRSLSASIRTPAASSKRALLMQETTRLEPKLLEHKYYVRGIGEVFEQLIKGGREKVVLQSVTGL